MCMIPDNEEEVGHTACTIPELPLARRLVRPGGHHFDGNYEAIGQAILTRLSPRQTGMR